jgi:hypothetical protein
MPKCRSNIQAGGAPLRSNNTPPVGDQTDYGHYQHGALTSAARKFLIGSQKM